MSDARLDEVLVELNQIMPVDEREASSLVRMLDEARRLEHPFDEEADPVHFTASGFVIGTRGTILHLHRKLHIWVQPGGHVDGGENPAEAARRETEEETGLQTVHPPGGPVLLHVDCHPGPRDHTHLDLRYVLLCGNQDPQPPPGESQDVRWYSFEEAVQRCEPGLRAGLARLGELWESAPSSWREKVEELNGEAR